MKLLPLMLTAAFGMISAAHAEDGYDLWLRYHPLEKPALESYRSVTNIVVEGRSATSKITSDELVRGLSGLLARKVTVGTKMRCDAVVVGTPTSTPAIASYKLPLDKAGSEGFVIRSVETKGCKEIVIAGNTDVGALHGAFHFLKLVQTRAPVDHLDIASAPAVKIRLWNHWDSIDGRSGRGYAGSSIFNWWEMPQYMDPRYTDYARANASIGINAVMPAQGASRYTMSPAFLTKLAALADLLRPYGIKVFMSASFSAPIEIGGLKTNDPTDPGVAAFWKTKVNEIYQYIPDFGGFVIKSDSEGAPGPSQTGHTQAEGANVVADALAPHGGTVLWRAFVYSDVNPEDRIKQEYSEFKPLDGKFRDNVVVQSKNGPLDFQPREPFSAVFGAMPHTNLGAEIQPTKEYLGFETHLVYLGTYWQEFFQTDTYGKGPGSTVAKVVDGSLFNRPLSAINGVGNVGSDRDWCGSTFNQANWYAFGRLAWNPADSAEAIADDWIKMTFTADPAFVKPVKAIMMSSRETAVNYMTPLGLTHQMGTDHHYGPGPWIDDVGRPDWNPTYYNGANKGGIGFDRTAAGSNAVSQYAPEVAAQYSDPKKTPPALLLWFHHLPWTYVMPSGRTLWDELVIHYTDGEKEVGEMAATWQKMKPYVDAERFNKTADFFEIQKSDAKLWRDASIAYFQSVSGLPLPAGMAAPEHPLSYYKALTFPYAPGHEPVLKRAKLPVADPIPASK